MRMWAPVLVHTSLSKIEAAERISESLLGGIPFVDAQAHFGFRVCDESPVLRSMRPVLGHYFDLIGDGAGFQLQLSRDVRLAEVDKLDVVDAMDFMVELLNLIDGIRAERGGLGMSPPSGAIL